MHELIIWALHFYNFLLLRIKLHAAHIRILMCLYSLIGAAFRTFTCKINILKLLVIICFEFKFMDDRINEIREN